MRIFFASLEPANIRTRLPSMTSQKKLQPIAHTERFFPCSCCSRFRAGFSALLQRPPASFFRCVGASCRPALSCAKGNDDGKRPLGPLFVPQPSCSFFNLPKETRIIRIIGSVFCFSQSVRFQARPKVVNRWAVHFSLSVFPPL